MYWASRTLEGAARETQPYNRPQRSDFALGVESHHVVDDVLVTPTAEGQFDQGFSMCHSPQNNAEFGVFATIRNGGHIRVNWRIVPFPSLKDQKDDPVGTIAAERDKICGTAIVAKGMPGIGRAYSVKMGVVAFNGSTYSVPTELQISLGQTLTFRINGGELEHNFSAESGVDLADLNNTVEQLRIEADSALQVGEQFLMNRSLFRVTSRPEDVWSLGKTFDYILECVGITGANNWVGIIGTGNIESTILSVGGDEIPPKPEFKGSNWYPLHRYATAKFKNTRITEVTEFGIRSNVWAQANGLCNFPSLPTQSRLADIEKDGNTIQSGTLTGYVPRTSAFLLSVRRSNELEAWDNLGEAIFIVEGSSPTDVFNYIRIYHPAPDEYMFRLLPKCATNFRWARANATFFSLSASAPVRTVSAPTAFGTFRLQFNAHVRTLEEVKESKIFYNKKEPYQPGISIKLAGLSRVGTVEPTGVGGLYQAFLETLLGGLKSTGAKFGDTRSAEFTINDTTKGIRVRCRVTAYVEFMGAAWNDRWTTAKAWYNPVYELLDIEAGSPGLDEEVLDTRVVASNSVYAQVDGYTGRNIVSLYRLDEGDYANDTVVPRPDPVVENRIFETGGKFKESFAYNEMATSAESNPEHKVVYVNESLQTVTTPTYIDTTTAAVEIKASRQIQSLQQIQFWLRDGIEVEHLADQPNSVTYGPSNNFADFCYYLLTAKPQGTGAVVAKRTINKAGFIRTARFLETNFWTFDFALADKVNVRDFLTQLASLNLCHFMTRNGRFSMEPALPCDLEGNVIRDAVPISSYFNDGNIIEDSFELAFLPEEQRRNFKAVIKYRRSAENSVTEERSIVVTWDEDGADGYAEEEYDVSAFCTKRGQSFAIARYLLSTRRRIDHVVKFKTIADGIVIAPGTYIRVDTLASPYEGMMNGVVRSDGSILSASTFEDGARRGFVYYAGSDGVVETDISIANGQVADPAMRGALFNIPTVQKRFGVYLVDEVTFEDDGLVSVIASHHPVDKIGRSKITADVFMPSSFRFYE